MLKLLVWENITLFPTWLIQPKGIDKLIPAIIIRDERIVGSDRKRTILQHGESRVYQDFALITDLSEESDETNTLNQLRSCTVECHNYLLDPGPPLSQISQGSSLLSFAFAVSEPFCFSNPQKKRVSLGCPERLVPILPAKLRGSFSVTLGNGSVTSKSVRTRVNQLVGNFYG